MKRRLIKCYNSTRNLGVWQHPMINNGIKFVRVVKTPIVDYRDFSNQLDQGSSFQDVMKAVVKDWHRDTKVDAETREDEITATLDIVKAEFSSVDINRIIPMFDNEDPQDIAFNAKCGQAYQESAPSHVGPGLLDSDKQYQVHPTTLSLREVREHLKTAKEIGYCAGIPLDELLHAKGALENEHSHLLGGTKNFNNFDGPASMVLSGAMIKASTQEERDDILLNVLFAKTPESFHRLSTLAHAQPR